jgi:hypothetical protein
MFEGAMVGAAGRGGGGPQQLVLAAVGVKLPLSEAMCPTAPWQGGRRCAVGQAMRWWAAVCDVVPASHRLGMARGGGGVAGGRDGQWAAAAACHTRGSVSWGVVGRRSLASSSNGG